VQGLQRSLRGTGARRPLVVMFTPDTLSSEAVETLRREGCWMRPVQRYTPPAGAGDRRRYKLDLYAECWTKLRLWEWEGQFERLVYLDADVLVVQNIDHLFYLPPGFYAVPDCAFGRATQAERDACPLLPLPGAAKAGPFNAGMMVITPSRRELRRFEALLATGDIPIGGFAEQDFLNGALRGEWRALPPAFNLQKGIKFHHPELWQPSAAAVIHYTDRKPWDEPDHEDNRVFADITDLWWRLYTAHAPPAAAPL
jgi:inositol 3-alpha-galactosyltransferase